MAMKEGQILIKDADNTQFTIIKSWSKMKWSRAERMFYGPAEIELLNKLAGIVRLPGPIEAERQRLNEIAQAVDAERMKTDPEPLYKYPVKFPLFKHQTRAANMALITFGLVPPPENRGEARMNENVLQRMERIDAKQKIASFMVKEKQPYDFKLKYATIRANEFAEECYKRGLNYHVSVGGLDSITLFLFLKSIHIDAPGISVSFLEDPSIQKIHKELGIERLKSSARYIDDNGMEHRWSKPQILQEFGFPVLSKEIAGKIETLANPTDKNKTVRHAVITGETGEYGGFQKNSRMKLSQKWLEKFGGYANEIEGTNYQVPPFKVSSKCCYYLKEKPCDDWAKEHNSVPYLGLMASEGGRRAKSLRINGCNYFGKSTTRSCPFAIFSRQDLLQLALDLEVPVPEIYGTIERKEDGTLYTTKAQRTGCSMCGFGIHLEKRPHRFDLLKEQHPKEWYFWMYECCVDEETGEKYGWAKVLDYIGVGY